MFFEIHRSALDSVDVTIFKVQNSIILILKIGKLGWIEYIDKDAFTELIYLDFHLEQKVNKYIQMHPKDFLFFSRRSLFVGWSRKLKVQRANCQRISSYPVRFSTDIVKNNNILFLLFFFGFFYFSIFFRSFCFLFLCMWIFFFPWNKKYIFWDIFAYAGG